VRRGLAWSAAIVAVGGLGALAYWEALKAGWIRYNRWDRRERGSLQVGHLAPDLELPLLEGGNVRLAELWRERPVLLVFGSCT
jgi:hypothetical protein